MLTNKTRSLNFNQTLDELLGGVRNKNDQGGLAAVGRPPTRHGRESVSSSEENRDPATSSESRKLDDAKSNLSSTADSTEDEFLMKLNEIRRRSLVNLKDVKENQRVRQPSEITEEAEEDANNNSTSSFQSQSKKLLSRPSTSESGGTYLLSPASKTDGPAPPKPPSPAPRNLPSANPEEEKKTSRNAKDHPTPSTFTSASSQHDAWLKKKLEEERKRKARQRAEAAKKEEEEKERKENAKKLFERWKAERDEKAREERRQRRAKEKEKQQAEEEAKKQKLKEAEKTFEAWKRSHSRPRTSSSKSDLEKQKQKEEAKKEAEKAFEAWKRNKDKAELARKRELAEKEEVKRKQLEEEREYRELLAQQTYETWLELKENERLLAQSISSLNFSEPPPLPWLPPSNTCPRQFVPSSKNRRRSLDRRPRATSAQAPRVRRAISVKSIFSMK